MEHGVDVQFSRIQINLRYLKQILLLEVFLLFRILVKYELMRSVEQ